MGKSCPQKPERKEVTQSIFRFTYKWESARADINTENSEAFTAAIQNQIMCAAAQKVLGYAVARVGSYFLVTQGNITTIHPRGSASPSFNT